MDLPEPVPLRCDRFLPGDVAPRVQLALCSERFRREMPPSPPTFRPRTFRVRRRLGCFIQPLTAFEIRPTRDDLMIDELQLLSLVQRAQQGEREAFGQLAREYESAVFAVVFRRLRNRSEAVEVTQEVFMRALRKIGQLREPERFVGWLKRIAVRMSINRAVRRPKELIQAPETFANAVARVAPVDRVLQLERADQVRIGLTQLRPLDRETLLAFYFEGQSLKQMSDRFASPVGTIKRRLHTARHRLKAALTEAQPA